MKAAVFYEPHRLRLEQRPTPSVGALDVLLRVGACGVCGTDLHIFDGEAKVEPPVILGHEYAGTVAEVGSEVTGLKVGDRVAIDPNIACGQCQYCRKGRVNLCQNLKAVGITRDGGFAELCVAPVTQVYKLPPHVPLEWGAFCEPISCCIRGIERAEIQLEDTVVIIGGGNIGLLMVQLARAAGAGRLVVLEPLEQKRHIALRVGADLTLDPFDARLPKQIQEAIGDGADVVIECVGKPQAVELAVSLVRGGGRVLLFGLCDRHDTVTLRPQEIFYKELTLLGSILNPFTFQRAVNLLAEGKVSLEHFAIQRFGLDDLLSAFEEQRRGVAVKTLIVPA